MTREAGTATTARTALPACMWISRPATVGQAAATLWTLWRFGCAKAVSGPSSTSAAAAAPFLQTVWQMCIRDSYMIAEKAEVISAIGAAMAMLRDTVARTVIDLSLIHI